MGFGEDCDFLFRITATNSYLPASAHRAAKTDQDA